MPEPAPAVDATDPAACVPRALSTGRLAVVGNAPAAGGHGAAIDAAEHVVRFNNAAGFGAGTGRRVTHLVLVNRGGQMRAWLDETGFLDRPAVRAADAFLFPFPARPEGNEGEGDGACWTRPARRRLAGLGRPVHVLPEAAHAAACAALAPHGATRPNPSTGFLVVRALLARRAHDAPPVEAYGFAFAGWPGHPWAAERRWFAARAAEGRLRVHPPCPPERETP